ncbi:MAG TPA: DedA family protein [Stellaceae bacterium]|nr:DedA family protein [Stellaceae bacterium]
MLSSLWSNRLRLLAAAGVVLLCAGAVLVLSRLLRDADVPRLIQEYGLWFYLLTFGWTFVEGETFVLVAAFFAAQGLLSAPVLLAAAWLGSFAGDQCYFWIGRRWGLRLLSQRPHWRGPVDSALGWVKRYDTWFILSFRFIYGVRNFSSFALGISGIGWRRFLLLNCLAAMLWALIFVGSGYFCGRALEHMLGRIAHEASVIALAAFVVGAIAAAIIHRRRRRRREATAVSPLS